MAMQGVGALDASAVVAGNDDPEFEDHRGKTCTSLPIESCYTRLIKIGSFLFDLFWCTSSRYSGGVILFLFVVVVVGGVCSSVVSIAI
eukprot:6419114-Amphidinium_carterae.1